MKGQMFTGWIEWVENNYSDDIADAMIERANLPHSGVYTAVGTYDHEEFVQLLTALIAETGDDLVSVVHRFGIDLFTVLVSSHAGITAGIGDAFSMLERVEGHIHEEVLKLYPQAQVPSVKAERTDYGMRLVYDSPRPFAELAAGLIMGCGQYFGEPLTTERRVLPDGRTEFHIRKVAA